MIIENKNWNLKIEEKLNKTWKPLLEIYKSKVDSKASEVFSDFGTFHNCY